MIRNICIITTVATSVTTQARLFQSALADKLPPFTNVDFIVLAPVYPSPLEFNKKLKSCDLAVFFLDPFYQLNPLSMPQYSFLKFTADGVQLNNAINASIRLICERHECYANTQYSKHNLEVNDIKVKGLVYDGIRNIPVPPINPVSQLTMLGFYNHGGNPMMDRKGQNIATALLVKLMQIYDFTTIVGSNVDYLHYVASKYVEVIEQKTVRKRIGDSAKIEEISYGFGEPKFNYDGELFSYASPSSLLNGFIRKGSINYVLIGGLSEMDLRILYALSDYFLFPSLTEGFGVPPIEALNTGRFVIANSYQTAKELLPTNCTKLIKPSHILTYDWGHPIAPMRMQYVYPDMGDFTDAITQAITNGITYDKYQCVKESLKYEYRKSYEPLVKKVMEVIK